MLTQLRRTASFTKSRTSRVTSVCSAVSDHPEQQGIRTLAAWILVLMERYALWSCSTKHINYVTVGCVATDTYIIGFVRHRPVT